ncbi:MAG: hypothetical protein D6772_06800 [Bacteroidetes bacterium]|nr:MAG: hypothetical protein D6772_06800 [Bacteroidota bacterium]
MTPLLQHKTDEQLLAELRHLLLRDEREEIAELRRILEERPQLEQRVDPIIRTHLRALEENFPRAYFRVVEKIVDQRIRQKQEEIINIITPRMGLMIRNYINAEFRKLRERVDRQIKRSPLSVFSRKSKKSADQIIMEANPYEVEEVYIVSHESGLLLGSASSGKTADIDMIAGMLTAIKSFVEDAFRRTDEELSAIQYGSYQILVHNFYNYYIALAVSGVLSEADRDQLTHKILTFAKEELNYDLQEPDAALHATLKHRLEDYFIPKGTSKKRIAIAANA